MNNHTYIVATVKPWNIQAYYDVISHFPGDWHLITEKEDLTAEQVTLLKPKYIFFPHWSYKVSEDILEKTTCVCFHETNLPYGRGGSPLQNLIDEGHENTQITAFKMNEEIDAGPVYSKRSLSLLGLAEEIFLRASLIVADMINDIVTNQPTPTEQSGQAHYFTRRTPKQSQLNNRRESLKQHFDFIRMLDAETYPKAYLESDGFRYEFSRPALKTAEIIADVRITKIEEEADD